MKKTKMYSPGSESPHKNHLIEKQNALQNFTWDGNNNVRCVLTTAAHFKLTLIDGKLIEFLIEPASDVYL